MKAFINKIEDKGRASLVEIATPVIKDYEVLVKVYAVSINQRDLRMVDGNYSFKFKWGNVLGADCSGQIVAIGTAVTNLKIGDDVVINPNVNWGDDFHVPSEQYSILGSPLDGVFQEYIAINSNRVHIKPEHLSYQEAACLPLTGLTAYRALFTKANLNNKDSLLITGISGNVAQLLMKFSLSMKVTTYVTSSKKENIELAIKDGAVGGINYKRESITNINSKFDVVINAGGGNEINEYLSLMNPNGKIVIYGAMSGKVPQFDLFSLYYNQVSIIGTLMGNDHEFKDMLDFVNKNHVIPTIDSEFNFSDMNKALSRLRSNNHYGKIVLTL